MRIGVVSESSPAENRVAIVPAVVPGYIKSGLQVLLQRGAGEAAGFPDSEYEARGVRICGAREEVFRECDLLCQVRTAAANPTASDQDLRLLHSSLTIIGLADPLQTGNRIQQLAQTGVRSFGLELLPRITRAQTMDVLSSQATVAGYKAVTLAAEHLPRMFPMMMTAAGTVAAAKVFVIGAGVAGLQAIATAKRLGAIIHAYDVRPAVKEQVQSLGAKFVELDLQSSEDQGGYAQKVDESFYRKQRELMARHIAEHDVVISTAAVPGAPPPLLITAEMVGSMPRGSVIVDLAARSGELGGNCELTRPDETVRVDSNGATVLGPTNLAATVPHTASQMFARNMAAFVGLLVKDGQLKIDKGDEIIAATLLTEGGAIANQRVRDLHAS